MWFENLNPINQIIVFLLNWLFRSRNQIFCNFKSLYIKLNVCFWTMSCSNIWLQKWKTRKKYDESYIICFWLLKIIAFANGQNTPTKSSKWKPVHKINWSRIEWIFLMVKALAAKAINCWNWKKTLMKTSTKDVYSFLNFFVCIELFQKFFLSNKQSSQMKLKKQKKCSMLIYFEHMLNVLWWKLMNKNAQLNDVKYEWCLNITFWRKQWNLMYWLTDININWKYITKKKICLKLELFWNFENSKRINEWKKIQSITKTTTCSSKQYSEKSKINVNQNIFNRINNCKNQSSLYITINLWFWIFQPAEMELLLNSMMN